MSKKDKKKESPSVAETLCGTELRGIGSSIKELENEILKLGGKITVAAKKPQKNSAAKKRAKPGGKTS